MEIHFYFNQLMDKLIQYQMEVIPIYTNKPALQIDTGLIDAFIYVVVNLAQMIKNRVNCPIIIIFGTTTIKLITKKTGKIPKNKQK